MRRALKLVPFLLAGAGAAMAQTQFTIQIVTSSPLPTGQVGATYLPSGATEQLAARQVGRAYLPGWQRR